MSQVGVGGVVDGESGAPPLAQGAQVTMILHPPGPSGQPAPSASRSGAAAGSAGAPRAARGDRPVDLVDTSGEPYRKAIAWLDQQSETKATVEQGISLLQNGENKKAWFERPREHGLRAEDRHTALQRARVAVAKYLVAYPMFREKLGCTNLDAVVLFENDAVDLDLAGEDGNGDGDGDGVSARGLGKLGFVKVVMYGDGQNTLDLVQRVGAMIKQLGGSFDVNATDHKIKLGGLLTSMSDQLIRVVRVRARHRLLMCGARDACSRARHCSATTALRVAPRLPTARPRWTWTRG